jgi:hypothetical protein
MSTEASQRRWDAIGGDDLNERRSRARVRAPGTGLRARLPVRTRRPAVPPRETGMSIHLAAAGPVQVPARAGRAGRRCRLPDRTTRRAAKAADPPFRRCRRRAFARRRRAHRRRRETPQHVTTRANVPTTTHLDDDLRRHLDNDDDFPTSPRQRRRLPHVTPDNASPETLATTKITTPGTPLASRCYSSVGTKLSGGG